MSHASDACEGVSSFDAPESFVRAATDAVKEWLARNSPIDADEFDRLRARFAREPGEPFDVDGVGRNPHVRVVDAGEIGTWVATNDVALVDLDDTVRWADLHGIPVVTEGNKEAVVPLVVVAGGPPETVAQRFHEQYHALERIRDRLGGQQRIMTDGGGADDPKRITNVDETDPDTGTGRSLAPGDWRRILEAIEGVASYHTVVDAVRDALEISRDSAQQALDDALAGGTLAERDTGKMFDEVVLQREPPAAAPVSDDDDHPDDQDEDDVDAVEIPTEEAADTWADVDFAAPNTGIYPPTLLEREQWMGHRGKRPFAPWTDRDADIECTKDTCVRHDPKTTPESVRQDCDACQRHAGGESVSCAECDHDARNKWGFEGNYVDGPTVAKGEADPRLDGRVFLQQDDDPFGFVDGDDVRDPETGEVHPAFIAMLEHLGMTYADISTSGSGVHANYRGELPGDGTQATFQLDDEPWGANDDLPTIEIYANKHVCVATGDHVPGTPTEVTEWDADTLEAILEATDQLQQRPDPSDRREGFDADDHDPDATDADETATDIRDLFHAIDHLNVERVAEKTIVRGWNDSASTGAGNRAFYPEWGPDSNGTATYVDTDQGIYVDTGDHGAT